MKVDQITVGGVYLTRIGGALAAVKVTGEARRRFDYSSARETGPRRFYVARVGEASNLPKSRNAAALRPVPAAIFHMKGQPWPVEVTRDFALPEREPLRAYVVKVPAFAFETAVAATSAAEAAVLASRGMVATAVFGWRTAPPVALAADLG